MTKHILLVDDSHDQRIAIKFALARSGFRCSDVAAGATAVKKIKEVGHLIDACVLDLRLKETDSLSGFDTLREIRALDSTLPILVYSGSDDEYNGSSSADNATAAGATLFVRKADPVALPTVIDSLVLHREAAKDVERREQAISLMQKLPEHLERSAEEIADFVAGFLHDNFGFARVRIYLCTNGSESSCRGVACRGMQDEFDIKSKTLASDDPMVVRAFTERQPFLLTHDYLKSNDDCFEDYDKEGVRQQLVVPLVGTDGNSVGTISVDDKNSNRPVGLYDRDLMSLVASYIASTILRSERRRREAQQVAWLRAIERINASLIQSLDPRTALSDIVVELAGPLKADVGVFLLRGEDWTIS